MKYKCILLIIFTIATNIDLLAQQTILLPSGLVLDSVIKQMPYRDVVKQDDGFVVSYTFASAIKHRNLENDSTEFLKIQGFGFSHREGLPCLPKRWDSFVIPDKNYFGMRIKY